MKIATNFALSAILVLPACTTFALSSIGIRYNNKNGISSDKTVPNLKPSVSNVGSNSDPITNNDVAAAAPWRVVLDIGREPLANMPFDWARSGCRMPLKIPCDFTISTVSSSSSSSSQKQTVEPQMDTVSFTGPDGAVIRPIQSGGAWNINSGGKLQQKPYQDLTFALQFPETLERRDVTIDAGTTLHLTGQLYTQSVIDRLNQEFYNAREEAWELGAELNDMVNIQGPPKKWNEELNKWEKKSKTVNPLHWAQKNLAYNSAKARQSQANERRPDPNSLSEKGALPGISDGVYVVKEGLVKNQKGAVMGRWSMQPILKDRAVSYYN